MRRETGKRLRDSVTFLVTALCFGLWGMSGVLMRPSSYTLGRVLGLAGEESGDVIVTQQYYWMFLIFALPAGVAVRRYGFKTMVVIGLLLFWGGALSFVPASEMGTFGPFAVGYMLMAAGLLCMQMSANPYALTYGARRRGLFRIMAAQCVNAGGWLLGYYVTGEALDSTPLSQQLAGTMILNGIAGSVAQRDAIWSTTWPYLVSGFAALGMAVAIGWTAFYDKPYYESPRGAGLREVVSRLFHDNVYVFGMLSQFAYVMAQTLCWTSIISYGTYTLMETGSGMSRAEASASAMSYLHTGLVVFVGVRLVAVAAAYFDRLRASAALMAGSVVAAAMCGLSAASEGYMWLSCMVVVSGCMSVMFPSIYYLSMRRQNVSGIQMGTAGHVLSICGNYVAMRLMPENGGVAFATLLSMALFACVAAYAWWCRRVRVGV